jgi:predicted alpha/beta hydrolase family esterase
MPAGDWGSWFHDIGAPPINADSNLGDWPSGYACPGELVEQN